MTLTIVLRPQEAKCTSEESAYTTVHREEVPKETVLEIIDAFLHHQHNEQERHEFSISRSMGTTDRIVIDSDRIVFIQAEGTSVADETASLHALAHRGTG